MSSEELYVQYGCGLSCPARWQNYDSSPRLRLEQMPLVGQLFSVFGTRLFPHQIIFGDIVKGLPLQDETANGIYCSHILEHLDRSSVEVALRNTLRLLKPGGTFRLVVPDLYWRALAFIRSCDNGDAGAADIFMRSSYLGKEHPTSSSIERLRAIFGNSAHRWMYDEKTMATLLDQAGFVAIRRCRFNDSDDPAFADVEDPTRFSDSGHQELSMEAKKPLQGNSCMIKVRV